ncbi:MAG TPA: universal stress protein [Salinimicrobium sp.]|nr:universal stress protein [Salinimicrobium sp.]
MKKVLIAIDYHPVSEQVVEAGRDLAKQIGAEICLIHVEADAQYYAYQYPVFMGFEPIAIDMALVSGLQERSKDFLKSAAESLDDPSVSTHLAVGETASAILEHAKNWNADIIVMGTHSHSVIEKMMGTVASSVLEKTEIPVFMIPVKNNNK